nr:hypothetical protein [Tanacetum cinerariifolium]
MKIELTEKYMRKEPEYVKERGEKQENGLFGFGEKNEQCFKRERTGMGKDGSGKDVGLHLYRSMIGSLMYLTASRPDIMFAVYACVRHQVTPKECHLHAVKRIFRYLKEKGEHNVDFHPMVDFIEASPLRARIAQSSALPPVADEPASPIRDVNQGKACPTDSSFVADQDRANIAKTSTLPHESTSRGEGLGTPTEPHHTPSLEAQQSPHTALSSPSLPPATTEIIPTSTSTEIPTLRQYSRRARIAQSSALPTAADEPASLLGYDSQGEACPTVSVLEAGQDRANIIKTSALPHDSTPRVTSLAADEGSMKQQLNELTDLYTRLQRQQSEMDTNLETREEAGVERSTEKGSNDSEELVNVLTSFDATNILTSEVQVVSVPPVAEVSTVCIYGMVPTASPIFTIASVVTPYLRCRGKEKMVESYTSKKKKLQEKIDVQVAREMEEQMARKDQRRSEQIERDAEIARIHAEEELQMLIDGLDRNNEEMSLEKSKKSLFQFGSRLKTLCLWLLNKKEKDLREKDSVKETLSIRQATIDKDKELWVELKRLFEPDVKDQLWTDTQALMHDPLEWRLYDSCGVHYVLTRDQEIFMLVEKDYSLRKGLAIASSLNKAFDDEEANVQRALEESLKSVYDAPRGPLPPVVIREPESGNINRFQRRTSTPTGSSGYDESSSLYVELGLIDSEVESNEDVQGMDVGVQDEGQAGPKPGEQDEGQARPNPGDATASQPLSSPVVHARPNLEHMDLEATDISTKSHPKQMDEGFTTTAYPKVQENLKLTVEE